MKKCNEEINEEGSSFPSVKGGDIVELYTKYGDWEGTYLVCISYGQKQLYSLITGKKWSSDSLWGERAIKARIINLCYRECEEK